MCGECVWLTGFVTLDVKCVMVRKAALAPILDRPAALLGEDAQSPMGFTIADFANALNPI
jgi:hypothetical protein